MIYTRIYKCITNAIVSILAAGRPISVWPDIFLQGCRASSSGRERRLWCPASFLRPWPRKYCSLERRPACSPPAWARPWRGFRPRWRDGWQGRSRGRQRTGSGYTPRQQRQGRRRGYWRWRNTSGGARTHLHSTLICDHCLTYVRGRRGILGRESRCGGRNKRELIWQGPERRQQQWSKRRGERSEGEE